MSPGRFLERKTRSSMLPSKTHSIPRRALGSVNGRLFALCFGATMALGAAMAAATTNWTYVINYGHQPVINEGAQSGNFQIWGLGYARVIVGSQGSNVIVADGDCPPGSTATDYCSVAPVKHSRNSLIYAEGSGQNTVYAGYGPSVIIGGTGPNTITSSPTSSLIFGGNAGDTINANQGATVVWAGTGVNTIYALSPAGDTVHCSGTQDTVYAYTIDHIYNCAHVFYQTAPSTAGNNGVGNGNGNGNIKHGRAPSLRHNSLARRFYARHRAAERRARRW